MQEPALRDVMDTLRWRWKVVVLVALSVVVGATLYVESLPAEYEAEAVVALAPNTEAGAAADTVRIVAPKYVEYVTAPSTVVDVAPAIGLEAATIQEALDAAVATDTGNLTITARTTDPDASAEIANAFAEEAVSFSRGDELISADMVATALPPRAPSGPPRKLLEAASLVVGLLIGVGASVLLERGRPRLRSSYDIGRITGHPVIGRIPRARILRKDPAQAFADPAVGAAFRTLRANLERHWQDRTVDSIVVTSAGVGDGKTTIAALLAESLARLGARTLLIDADLRRPKVGETFGLKGVGDLSAILRDEAELVDSLEYGWTDDLWVLPTTRDEEAGDLLARSFPEVIKKARERFEIIVIDSPPLIGTDDARTLSTQGAGVVLVVSANSDARAVNEAVIALESLQAKILGIVGNRIREAGKTYYA